MTHDPDEVTNDLLADEKQIVEELCEIDHGLTEWEINFVEAMHTRVIDERTVMTPRQREVALNILARY